MNLNSYQTFYIHDEGHWYISKIKQYDEENINVMAQGLLLISNLLSPLPNANSIQRFKKFRNQELLRQMEMFEIRTNQIPIDDDSQLFLSLEILVNGLVDLTHLEHTNPEKYNIFTQIRKEFIDGRNAVYFVEKYQLDYLRRELTVYFRNFLSWLSKFGFIGKQAYSDYCFITDAGNEFALNSENSQTTAALFRNQIQKVQVWNPTLPEKYRDFKVIPYYVILQVLTLLPDHKFSRCEYILFVTKIKSHREQDIQNTVNLIQEFRLLTPENQEQYIDEIIENDKTIFPGRFRTNYERIKDSAGKEIYAYTFGSIVGIQADEVTLIDPDQAKQELDEFQKSPQYIEFETKQDWVRHLGSLDGLKLDEIIDVYVRSGKNAEEIKEILKNVEKDIGVRIEERLLESEVENFYVQNIDRIHSNLRVIREPKPGQQFQTDIGVIDVLCKDRITDEYVVIEFKRAQVSDDTIGQVLRYMGWVSMNMEKKDKKVRGIIVGRNFSEKLHYSIFGVQDESFLDLLTLHAHPFDSQNRPTSSERV